MLRKAQVAALLVAAALPTTSHAGAVGRACISADRPAASQRLCSCIDRAATQTLSVVDQNRAGRLLRSPELAERTQQSSRKSDKEFWKNYIGFANAAERSCR